MVFWWGEQSIANREFVNPALDGARNAASKIITFLLQKFVSFFLVSLTS